MPPSRPSATWRRPLLLLGVVALIAAGCGVHAGDAANELSPQFELPETTTTAATATTTAASTTTAANSNTTTTERPVRNEADVALRSAVYGTLQAPRYTIQSSSDMAIFGEERHLRLDGSVDMAAHIGDLNMTISEGDATSTVHALADGSGLWLEAHYPGGTMPPGKVWLGGSATELSDSLVLAPTSILPLVLLLQATVGATMGPSKSIDGVTATRYDATVRYKDALHALGPLGQSNEQRTAFELALPGGRPPGPEVQITVWVGSDDVIRDFQLTIIERSDEAEPGTTGSAQIILSNVGLPVEPPAAPDPSTVEVVTDELIGFQILHD